MVWVADSNDSLPYLEQNSQFLFKFQKETSTINYQLIAHRLSKIIQTVNNLVEWTKIGK